MIAIKEMNTPNRCAKCKFCLRQGTNNYSSFGKCLLQKNKRVNCLTWNRDDNCPLVEVGICKDRKSIKVLDKEPCEDAVSRAEAIDAMTHWFSDMLETRKEKYSIDDVLNSLSPVTPTPKWIPVSERLPEEMGTYMTTIDYGEHGLVTGQRYYYGRGLKWNDECVIAWMPLPEPYKAESEDKE